MISLPGPAPLPWDLKTSDDISAAAAEGKQEFAKRHTRIMAVKSLPIVHLNYHSGKGWTPTDDHITNWLIMDTFEYLLNLGSTQKKSTGLLIL